MYTKKKLDRNQKDNIGKKTVIEKRENTAKLSGEGGGAGGGRRRIKAQRERVGRLLDEIGCKTRSASSREEREIRCVCVCVCVSVGPDD